MAKISNKFIVPKIPTGLDIAVFYTEAAIFSTGITAAKVLAKSQQLLKNSGNNNPFDKQGQGSDSIFPDAKPDGQGGFTIAQNWNGRMSSSLTGMPVMCSLRIVGTTYIALDGSTITIPDITFETVLITAKLGKNIEKTDVNSNFGSVKEWINQKDYEIEIRAIVTASAPVNDDIETANQDGVYPLYNMEAIMTALNAPISLQVECWYLNKLFNIKYIVIEDGVQINQVEGEYEMQRLVIPALSDFPLIITVSA